ARLVGDGMAGGMLRIEDDLHDPAGIAEVEEDEAAVVAAAMHPAREPHGAPGISGPEVTAGRVFQHQSSLAGRGYTRPADRGESPADGAQIGPPREWRRAVLIRGVKPKRYVCKLSGK